LFSRKLKTLCLKWNLAPAERIVPPSGVKLLAEDLIISIPNQVFLSRLLDGKNSGKIELTPFFLPFFLVGNYALIGRK